MMHVEARLSCGFYYVIQFTTKSIFKSTYGNQFLTFMNL